MPGVREPDFAGGVNGLIFVPGGVAGSLPPTGGASGGVSEGSTDGALEDAAGGVGGESAGRSAGTASSELAGWAAGTVSFAGSVCACVSSAKKRDAA